MDTQDKETEQSSGEVTKTVLVAWVVTATLVAVIATGLAVSLLSAAG